MGGDQPPEPNAVDELGLPADFRGRRGSITTTKTLPQFKKFLEGGGTIVAIGQSTSLGKDLGLPLPNHLAAKDEDVAATPVEFLPYADAPSDAVETAKRIVQAARREERAEARNAQSQPHLALLS